MHDLLVAAILTAMTLGMVALVVATEDGAAERLAHRLAYHRRGGRHARRALPAAPDRPALPAPEEARA